jgi:hypothetical protein
MIIFEVDNTSLSFPNPELGNSEFLDLKTVIKLTMTSTVRTLIKTPTATRYRMSFTLLSGCLVNGTRVPPSHFLEELITFVSYAIGKTVKFTNFDNSIQNIKFTRDTLEYLNSGRNFSTVTLEMEKV